MKKSQENLLSFLAGNATKDFTVGGIAPACVLGNKTALKSAKELQDLGIIKIFQNPKKDNTIIVNYAVLGRDAEKFAAAGWTEMFAGDIDHLIEA